MSVAPSTRESRPEPTKFYRWLVLMFLSLAMFGNYYFYDALEPLAKLLQDQLHFSAQNIGTLQAAYSFPNIFTVVLGGILIDRIGTRKALVIFSVLCLVGAIITAFGAAFPMMVAGRFVFGMGAESLIVAITTGVAKWFKGKELSFALGINLMIARGGTFLAQNSPSWARGAYNYWQNPWLIGVGFVALCVVGAVGYYILEVRAEKRSSLAPEGEQDKIVFADVKAFNLSYWYLVGLCVVFYSAIFPFETFAVTYFVDAKHTSLQLGGWMLSTLTMFTMIGTPIVGLFSDKVGRRATIMLLGTLLLIPVFLLMAYTNVSLYVPMAMLGFAFTLVPAIIWPSVAYLVPQRTLGTALGVMTMIQNLGMTGMNEILGKANDSAGASATNPAGYLAMMKILTLLGFIGFALAFLLRQRETGPKRHGLETITASSSATM
jgi:MFS family permease